MPPPLPYFKVNIYPFPLPHFASIFFAYVWSFRWPNYIVKISEQLRTWSIALDLRHLNMSVLLLFNTNWYLSCIVVVSFTDGENHRPIIKSFPGEPYWRFGKGLAFRLNTSLNYVHALWFLAIFVSLPHS
jgi:hypothetical protein